MYGKSLATMKDLEYCFKTSFMMLRAIFKQLLSLLRRKPKFDFLYEVRPIAMQQEGFLLSTQSSAKTTSPMCGNTLIIVTTFILKIKR